MMDGLVVGYRLSKMRCTSRPTAASALKKAGTAGACGAALVTAADCRIFGTAAEIVESATVKRRVRAERAARAGRCALLTDVVRAVVPAAEAVEDGAEGPDGDCDGDRDGDCSASAEAGVESAIATAVPTPSAAASTPTRPT